MEIAVVVVVSGSREGVNPGLPRPDDSGIKLVGSKKMEIMWRDVIVDPHDGSAGFNLDVTRVELTVFDVNCHRNCGSVLF